MTHEAIERLAAEAAFLDGDLSVVTYPRTPYKPAAEIEGADSPSHAETQAAGGEQFVHASAKSSKGGYGNRVVTTCTRCGAVVMDADPGNAAGARYEDHYRREAMAKHECTTQLDAGPTSATVAEPAGQQRREETRKDPPQWATDEAYRIVTEHKWGWEEEGSDDLTDDQQDHVDALAVELKKIVAEQSLPPGYIELSKVLAIVDEIAKELMAEKHLLYQRLRARLAPPLRKLHRCEGVRVVVEYQRIPRLATRYMDGRTPMYYLELSPFPQLVTAENLKELTPSECLDAGVDPSDWINPTTPKEND